MGLWQAPKVTNDMDLKQLKNLVQILINDLDFVINGNINSKNVREIGGYQVGAEYLRSKNGLVGLSSAVLGGGLDDVRIWAGNAVPEVAPFRVYNSGKAILSNIEIRGGVVTDADLSGALGGNYTQIGSTYLYTGTVKTDQLIAGLAKIGTALIEDLVVGGNVLMGPDAVISYGNVTGTKPPTDADNTYATIGYSRLTKITSTGVYTGEIVADQITGGKMTAVNQLQIGDINNVNKSIVMYTSILGGSGKVQFNAGEDGWGTPGLQISCATLQLDATDLRQNGETIATQTWVQNNAVAKFG